MYYIFILLPTSQAEQSSGHSEHYAFFQEAPRAGFAAAFVHVVVQGAGRQCHREAHAGDAVDLIALIKMPVPFGSPFSQDGGQLRQ